MNEMEMKARLIVDDIKNEEGTSPVAIFKRMASGRRSKEASQKLFDMGYTNVFEFGGIIDWTGEVVTGED